MLFRRFFTRLESLADKVLPLEKKPKVLGVKLDIQHAFTQHRYNIAVNVQQRNNVLKALTGSTWGGDKETLLATNQAIGHSMLSYCCQVWTPSPKDINLSRLQRSQKSTPRIATGCLKMADVAELHQEARELPVRQHNELISRSSPLHAILHNIPAINSATYREMTGRIDDDL